MRDRRLSFPRGAGSATRTRRRAPIRRGGSPSSRHLATDYGTDWPRFNRLAGGNPLWYYILREAAACAGGLRLGPVGGRIVAEVLIGLIDNDNASFRRVSAEWRPRNTLTEMLISGDES